jgi:ankyrin repeat protein
VKRGADVNLADCTASTPLHYACLYPITKDKYHQIDNSIPDAGTHTRSCAHVCAIRTPLTATFTHTTHHTPECNYAKQESQTNIIVNERKATMRGSNGNASSKVEEGGSTNDVGGGVEASDEGDMVQLFLDRGADVHLQCDGGSHPLHYAVMSGNKAACKLLLKAGARINATDYEGTTVSPLMRSLQPQSADVMRPVTCVWCMWTMAAASPGGEQRCRMHAAAAAQGRIDRDARYR